MLPNREFYRADSTDPTKEEPQWVQDQWQTRIEFYMLTNAPGETHLETQTYPVDTAMRQAAARQEELSAAHPETEPGQPYIGWRFAHTAAEVAARNCALCVHFYQYDNYGTDMSACHKEDADKQHPENWLLMGECYPEEHYALGCPFFEEVQPEPVFS